MHVFRKKNGRQIFLPREVNLKKMNGINYKNK